MEAKELYNETILKAYKNPLNKGKIDPADLEFGGGNRSCGDSVTYTLKLKNNKVEDIKFEGHGCSLSLASASLLTEIVKGKTIEEILNLKAQDIYDIIGETAKARSKCALLGIIVLQTGLARHQKNPKETKIENVKI